VVNGVECGGDVEETEAGDLLMADGRDQFIVERETSRVSVEWCLVKPDWWGLSSEFEER